MIGQVHGSLESHYEFYVQISLFVVDSRPLDMALGGFDNHADDAKGSVAYGDSCLPAPCCSLSVCVAGIHSETAGGFGKGRAVIVGSLTDGSQTVHISLAFGLE